jgi:hypothetical protein
MRELVQTHGENSAEDRSALLAAAIPLLTQLPLAALRMQLSRELADRVHIGMNEVNQLVQQHAAQRAKRQSLQQQFLGQRQVESGKRTGFQSKSSSYRSNAGVDGDALAPEASLRPSAYASSQAQVLAPRHQAISLIEKALVLLLRFPRLNLREPSSLQAFWPEILVEAMKLDGFSITDQGSDLAALSLHLDQVCAANPDRWAPWRKRLNRALAWVLLIDERAARSEFQGALLQLADQSIRVAIDQLVQEGLTSADDRERYEALVAQRRAIRSGETTLT